MKILLIGLGLIGQKHLEVLTEYFEGHEIIKLSHIRGTQSADVRSLYDWNVVETTQPDIAIISNPTHLHINTAIECAKRGMHLFLEKPLDMTLEQFHTLEQIVLEKKLSTYIAYCLRFNPVIEYLKSNIRKFGKVLHYRVQTTNHLPSWRPNTPSPNTYSGSKQQGGGVILDLSHEFDYTKYILGNILNWQTQFGKQGAVTQDSEDYIDIFGKAALAPFNLHINFLSHIPQRTIQIDFSEISLIANLKELEICFFKGRKVVDKIIFDGTYQDMYKHQMEYFFENLGNMKMINNIQEAKELLQFLINIKNG